MELESGGFTKTLEVREGMMEACNVVCIAYAVFGGTVRVQPSMRCHIATYLETGSEGGGIQHTRRLRELRICRLTACDCSPKQTR